MDMQTTEIRNANHPKLGSTTKVEPIKDLKAIKRIKKLREDSPRDLCLFTLGINTAFRANELLSIRVGQVNYLQPGDTLELKQSKTSKHRPTTLNGNAIDAIDKWLNVHPKADDENAPLFLSRKTHRALTVSAVVKLVKGWCAEVGLKGNYGSHTLRKTWGFHQLRQNKETKPHMVLPILMEAYGHATQQQTLQYLCIQSDEVADLYMQVEL